MEILHFNIEDPEHLDDLDNPNIRNCGQYLIAMDAIPNTTSKPE